MLFNKARGGIKPTNIMSLAFNTITTGKLALFVLSALIKGISSSGMASLSFPNSGKWHVKEIASHPTTHLQKTIFFFFLNQTFRDVSSFARRCNLRFGLPECNYLSWTSRAGLGMERQEDFPLSTGRPLVGKSAHLHLSWHYFKRGIPPELEFRGEGGRPVDTATRR